MASLFDSFDSRGVMFKWRRLTLDATCILCHEFQRADTHTMELRAEGEHIAVICERCAVNYWIVNRVPR